MDDDANKAMYRNWKASIEDLLADWGVSALSTRQEIFHQCELAVLAYVLAFQELPKSDDKLLKKIHDNEVKDLNNALGDLSNNETDTDRIAAMNLYKAIDERELTPLVMWGRPIKLRNRFIADIGDIFVANLSIGWSSIRPNKDEGSKIVTFVATVCNFVFNPDAEDSLSRDRYADILKEHKKLVKKSYNGA